MVWSREQEDKSGSLRPLVAALLDIPSLGDRVGRNMVVRELNRDLGCSLPVVEHERATAHLYSLAEACLGRSDGLEALLRVLDFWEQGSRQVEALHRVVARMSPLKLWSAHVSSRLFTLLTGVPVPDLADIYRQVAGADVAGLREQSTCVDVFRQLEMMNAGTSGLPLALIFVEHIATRVRTELAVELRAWSDEQVDQMGLELELSVLRGGLTTSTAPPPVPDSPAYLVLHLEHVGPTGDQYRLAHWHQFDASTKWAPVQGHDVVGDLASVRRHVTELVMKAESEWGRYTTDIRIEVILGYEHLNLDVDQWPETTGDHLVAPLGCRYRVVVRSLERMVSAQYHGLWLHRWKGLVEGLSGGALPHSACCHGRGVTPRGLRELRATLERSKDLVSLVLSAPPSRETAGRDEVAVGVRLGVPLIVWHREDCGSEAFTGAVRELLHNSDDSADFLERVKSARLTAYVEGPEANHFGGKLAILYDDPFRPVLPSHPVPPVGISA